MKCNMFSDVRINRLSATQSIWTLVAIRPELVSRGRSGSRCRLCYRKKLPNCENLSRGKFTYLPASSSLSTNPKDLWHRFVKIRDICALSNYYCDLTMKYPPYLLSPPTVCGIEEIHTCALQACWRMTPKIKAAVSGAQLPRHMVKNPLWNRCRGDVMHDCLHALAQFACLSAIARITKSSHNYAASSAICG